MREVIHHFYHSRYAACLAQLETLKPQLGLDLHLSPHVAALYAAVRHKALVQYTSPFSSVALPAMADAFNTSLG
jgi:COP9 signalosome complex subunit 1